MEQYVKKKLQKVVGEIWKYLKQQEKCKKRLNIKKYDYAKFPKNETAAIMQKTRTNAAIKQTFQMVSYNI